MTPTEIRREYQWDRLEPDHAPLMQVQVLGEIAAQLAELNQHFKVIADTMYADGVAKYGQ
jgi:hypothetical protein